VSGFGAKGRPKPRTDFPKKYDQKKCSAKGKCSVVVDECLGIKEKELPCQKTRKSLGLKKEGSERLGSERIRHFTSRGQKGPRENYRMAKAPPGLNWPRGGGG